MNFCKWALTLYTKDLFIKDHSNSSKSSTAAGFSMEDMLNMMKNEDLEESKDDEAQNKPKDGPQNLVEALEVELKASQIVDKTPDAKQDAKQSDEEVKSKSEEKSSKENDQKEKKILIEEVTQVSNTKEKVHQIKEPKYKTEKNRTHWKVFIHHWVLFKS